MALLQGLHGTDVARLGLHETTFWAMLTHSRFLPNLEINFDDSQTHLRLLSELVEASSYAPGGSAPDPQKYLPATERIADKYSGIIAAILPGNGDALQKLRTSDPSATRKLLSEKIKNLIGPSTTVRATMSLAKNVKLGANQQALSGRLEYKSDSKRSSEMGANGSTEVYFGRIDEFDSLIRQGGEVTLVMSKPWPASKTVRIRRSGIQEDSAGNLVCPLHVVFDPSIKDGGSYTLTPRIRVSTDSYQLLEGSGYRVQENLPGPVRAGRSYLRKDAPGLSIDASATLVKVGDRAYESEESFPYPVTIRVTLDSQTKYVPKANGGSVSYNALPGGHSVTAEALDPGGRILDAITFRLVSDWKVPEDRTVDLRKRVPALRDKNNQRNMFRSAIDDFNAYGDLINNQMERMVWSEALATWNEVSADQECAKLVATWPHGQFQLRDWRRQIANCTADTKTLFTVEREMADMFPKISAEIWGDLARHYLIWEHNIPAAWDCWLKSLPEADRAAAQRNGDKPAPDFGFGAWTYGWPVVPPGTAGSATKK